MPLGYDIARCTGQQCPSADNCQRYTERQVPKGVMVAMAAFYVRREPGDSACDGFMPVQRVSTFEVDSEGGEA